MTVDSDQSVYACAQCASSDVREWMPKLGWLCLSCCYKQSADARRVIDGVHPLAQMSYLGGHYLCRR